MMKGEARARSSTCFSHRTCATKSCGMTTDFCQTFMAYWIEVGRWIARHIYIAHEGASRG